MIPADTITRRAWADYEERNRRARDQYRAMPISTGHVAEAPNRPCTVCGRRTQSLRRVCRGCQEKR